MITPAPLNIPISPKGPSVSDPAWMNWFNLVDRLPVYVTATLPAAGTKMDGKLIMENTGTGANLIMYTGGARYRIVGGTAF
jgi:hypothetical protein